MAAIEYYGAQFYKCALQVNSASYAAQYRGQPCEDEDEAAYNEQILARCRANDIAVVGLANHGDVEGSEALRAVLASGGITVFPGFEIASSEKIHIVCLYPEETSVATLNQYLGGLMGANSSHLEQKPTHSSSLSCEQIATKVLDEQNGFWYAAHLTGKNGLLRLSTKAGDSYTQLWKKDELVIAGQIPGRLDDFEKEEQRKYRQIIENQNANYKRRKPIAIINAKDIKGADDLDNLSASCLIKMTEPTFAAFKQAFYDPESRIRLNYDTQEQPYSWIHSVEWVGAGFFQNTSLALSKRLNAIIGGRGSGKTTLLESIRYALELPVRDDNRLALERFWKSNLGNSQVVVDITSKAQNGERYRISRRYGEAAVVQNPQGEKSNLSPKDLLPQIDFLGQNEILALEKDEVAKLELLENLLPRNERFEKGLAELKYRLADNREQTLKAREEFDCTDAKVRQESKLQEQVEAFKKLGIEDKLNNVRLIERERGIQDRVDEQLDLVKDWLDGYQEVFDLLFIQRPDSGLPNATIIGEVATVLTSLQTQLDGLVAQANKHLQTARESYAAKSSVWQQQSDTIQHALEQAIAKLPEQAGKSGRQLGAEYKDIVKELELIKRQKDLHVSQKEYLTSLRTERQTWLEEYRQTAFARFDSMQKAVKQLNRELANKLRIEVRRMGNIEELRRFLLDIKGIGAAKIEWLAAKDIEIDLIEWSKWIAAKDKQALLDKYSSFGLTEGVAELLLGLNLEDRLKLEEIELKDTVGIQLNTAHADAGPYFVDLESLSTGQKCTAILSLLLFSRDEPLIIDQPEDNLDNAFIAERIVQDLRRAKTQRQFLFATHNANIPVFGDAELIAVLSGARDRGTIQHQGAIDKAEVCSQAANILEGGAAAFNTRRDKYGF